MEKYCIFRTYSSGVFAGELVMAMITTLEKRDD